MMMGEYEPVAFNISNNQAEAVTVRIAVDDPEIRGERYLVSGFRGRPRDVARRRQRISTVRRCSHAGDR